MLMKSNRKRHKKNFKVARRIRTTIFLLPISMLIVTIGLFVYAKYYSHDHKSSVAVAGSIYFTSNYAIKSESENEFFESIVAYGYQGTDYIFEFEVRNYENVMLFNDSSVVIPYSVRFWLGETTDKATYTVKYNDSKMTITADKENTAVFTDQIISGGKASANSYTISVDVAVEDGEFEPIPIYVEVVTDQGAILSRTLRGKMVFDTTVVAKTYIEAAEFIVYEDVESDEEQFEEIEKMSELIYEIRTVGNVVSNASVTDELKVSWNPDVLELDLYNDAYLEWLDSTGETGPLEDTNGWKYITIEVMSYSSNIIYFLRGDKYYDCVNSLDDLNQYISVENYEETSYIGEGGTD